MKTKSLCQLIFENNAAVFPATPQGKPIAPITPDIEIRDRETLLFWYQKRNIRRFVFKPCDSGLVGIDLDEKNGKSGIREYYHITGSDPREGFFVTSPSGGLHKCFYSSEDFVSCEIRPGIEIKSRAFITLPGSRSHKGVYTPHGNISEISTLPESLKKIIPVRNTHPVHEPVTNAANLGLGDIVNILNRQGYVPAAGNRNQYAFEFSKFARKQGHSPDTVREYLCQFSGADFTQREINATVSSAYRGVRI